MFFCGIFEARIAAAVAGLSGLITPTNNVLNCTLPDLPTDELLPELRLHMGQNDGEDVDNDWRCLLPSRSQWDCSIRCHISRPAGA
ncbi:hypothetical protein DMH88_01545 [Escherichia coli]|nr:hypothetical protein [Escherichia coli]